jgi:two-component system OmpR family sensor kinase
MSIRLRLTLLYSVILALTLVVFSSALYLMQSRTTMREYELRLAGATRILENTERLPFLIERPPRRRFPGQPYTQIRNLDGEVIESDPNLDGIVLPLGEKAFEAVTRGENWVETVSVEGERFLIHNQELALPDGTQGVAQIAVSLAERDQNLNTLGRILIVGSSIAVLFAFGVGWLLAGEALRPINRITQTAQAIGAERDFGRRVQHSGPKDEIGQLATTFNDMLTELQAAYRQVEQSLQVQKRFVADASHELRTPLTTILGNLGLLQRDPPISTEDRADVLNDTVAETERLIRLVNELLVLARADAKQPLKHEPVSVGPLIEDVHRQIRLLAPAWKIVCDPGLAGAVLGDHDAIKQVLLALLDNVIKHTPPETTISIATSAVDDRVVIKLCDDGPGIDSSRLPHIFDRFYQGDSARTGTGTGLGLAIAKELTEAQNGTIAVESQVGQGSVFTLTFPKAL